MLVQPSTAKKIRIIGFSFAIAGLLVELLPFSGAVGFHSGKYVNLVREAFCFLNLRFLGVNTFQYLDTDTGMRSNFINVVFYSLLLAGTVLYNTSKGRETRLLRFVMSIAFLSATVFLFCRLIFIIFLTKDITMPNEWLPALSLVTVRDIIV